MSTSHSWVDSKLMRELAAEAQPLVKKYLKTLRRGLPRKLCDAESTSTESAHPWLWFYDFFSSLEEGLDPETDAEVLCDNLKKLVAQHHDWSIHCFGTFYNPRYWDHRLDEAPPDAPELGMVARRIKQALKLEQKKNKYE